MKTLTLILMLGFFVAATNVNAAENPDEVTPELAKKAALYLLDKYHHGAFETGYPVRLSGVKTFTNYAGDLINYEVYIYAGPGDIPTDAELEKRVKDNDDNGAKWIRSYIIPANKTRIPDKAGQIGCPLTIMKKITAEKALAAAYPNDKAIYLRTVIEGRRIVWYVYKVKGNEILVNGSGEIAEPGLQYGADKPTCPTEYEMHARGFWSEVEASTIDLNTIDINKVDGSDFTPEGYSPEDWQNYMPRYQQQPGRCAATAAADFLGYYGAKGYVWAGNPYTMDQYYTQAYGQWICLEPGNSSRGLYYLVSTEPGYVSIGQLDYGLRQWLQYHASSIHFSTSTSDPYNFVNNWFSFTLWMNDYNGVVTGLYEDGQAPQGHAYATWGYKTEFGEHWIGVNDPENSGYFQLTELCYEEEILAGNLFAILRCDNPKHIGGKAPVVYALNQDNTNSKTELRWESQAGPNITKFAIIAGYADSNGRKTDKLVCEYKRSGQTRYAVKIQKDAKADGYWLITYAGEKPVAREKFPNSDHE